MYRNGEFVPNSTTATRRAARLLTQKWLHKSVAVTPIPCPAGTFVGYQYDKVNSKGTYRKQ